MLTLKHTLASWFRHDTGSCTPCPSLERCGGWLIALLGAVLAPETHASVQNPNLITNPGFEYGFPYGFTTDYLYTDPYTCWRNVSNYGRAPGDLDPGDYTVTDYPQYWNCYLDQVVDHTRAGTAMLVADGVAGRTVWQQTVNVERNTHYYFRFWSIYLDRNHAAPPTFRVDVSRDSGMHWIDYPPFSLPSTVDDIWRSSVLTVDTYDSPSLTFRIIDTNDAPDGNDFAIDDIELRKCSAGSIVFVPGRGINPEILLGDPPVLGAPMTWSLVEVTPGATFGYVKGRLGTPVSVLFYYKGELVEWFLPSGPEILNLPPAFYDADSGTASFSLAVPLDPALCRIVFTAQGIRLGGGTVKLSNGLKETIGS